MYLFHLIDNYAVTGITLLFTVFFEAVAVSWIYGEHVFLKLILLFFFISNACVKLYASHPTAINGN